MTRAKRIFPTPRPFLKWVGGKGQLLEHLMNAIDRAGDFGRYHEPFVGGGALFFALWRAKRLGRPHAYLSDGNLNLVETYQGVKENVDEVIALLRDHTKRHSEAYFYAMRAEVPDSVTARAARIIYLNKTCFNGLYRENSKGLFNTPFGRYKNPVICDEKNLRAASDALRHANIEARSFEVVLDHAKKGDLVYFDPPYLPVSKTSNFTAYAKDGFGMVGQERLAEVFAKLDRRGVKVMLSNSDAPPIRALYENFALQDILATRAVNSRGDRRGKVSELLVTNF